MIYILTLEVCYNKLGDSMSGKEAACLILGIICVILICIFMNLGEDMNYYSVTIGGNESSYYVSEKTKRIYIEDVITSSVNNSGYVKKNLVTVSLKDLNLSVKSYNCSADSKQITCKSYYELDKEPKLIDKDMKPVNLKIMKKDEVIYDGEYQENLKNIIKEKGRYYFIVNYEQRVLKAIKQINILFSVKVVD